MKKSRVTAKDVAKRAGVSEATVSMILNGKSNSKFPEKTCRRVIDACNELGYMPKKKTIVIIAVILLVLLVGYFHFCGIEIDRKFVITSVATENALDDKLPVTIKGKLKLNLDITWQFTGNIIIDGYEMTQNEAKYLLQLQLRHSQKMPGLLVGDLIYINPQLLWMEGCVGQIYTDLLFNKFIFLPATNLKYLRARPV